MSVKQSLQQGWRRARVAWETEVIRRWRRIVRRVLHQGVRIFWYGGAVLVVALAVLFTVARVLLPDLAERKGEFEQRLTEVSGRAVRIATLGTYWDGLSPGLALGDVAVLVPGREQPVVRLDAVHVSLAIVPLLWGEVRIKTLRLTAPRLAFERLKDQRYRVTGMDPVTPGTEGGGGEVFLAWLFRQHHVVIEDGELRWFDQLDPEHPLVLKHVNASLRNDGNLHRLRVDAEFPPDICTRCAAAFDVVGNPLVDADWSGKIYLKLAGVDTQTLPRVLREKLPAALRGRVTTEVWSEWEGGRPVATNGSFQIQG
ncbi:MAG: AsmA family protein, partial [Pseudomonadota bacterium]